MKIDRRMSDETSKAVILFRFTLNTQTKFIVPIILSNNKINTDKSGMKKTFDFCLWSVVIIIYYLDNDNN